MAGKVGLPSRVWVSADFVFAQTEPEEHCWPKMKKRLLIGLAFTVVLAIISFATVPHLLPSVLSFYRADISFAVPTKDKRMYITIDDSPSKSTSEILRVLKKHSVPATFFVIADCAKSPEQLHEIVAAKHSLGNHLRTFEPCSKLSLSQIGRAHV